MRRTLLLLLIGGCATRSPTSPQAPLATTGPATMAWAEPEVARRILDGVVVGEWGEPAHVGDAVLLGLQSVNGERVVTRYLLVTLTDGVSYQSRGSLRLDLNNGTRLEVVVAPPTRTATLTLYDERGRRIRTSPGRIAERTLNHGLYFLNFADAADNPAPSWGPTTRSTTQSTTRSTSGPATQVIDARVLAQAQAMALAMGAVFIFAQSSGSNSVLGELVTNVVERPSLLSLLRGVTLDIRLAKIEGCEATVGDSAGRPTSGVATWPASRITVDVRVNDRTALLADVTAVPPAPPLGLVSGIVAIEGHHPTDPTKRLHVTLLAARPGNGAAIHAYRVPGLPAPAK